MFKTRCMQQKYLIVFFLFLTAFYGYNIQRVYGFIFFPDEFGYWSYAAKALGYDWSGIVSLGSYYSYGYSLILLPILKIFDDAVTAYRAAVTVNFLMLGADALLLTRMAEKWMLQGENKENHIPLFVGMTLFYPPVLFYAKTSMVETVLMSMFLLIIYLLHNYLENNRLSTLTALLVVTVYIHFLHMRAIGIAIAVILTIFVRQVKNRKKGKHILIALLTGAVLLAAGFLLKTKLQEMLYGTAEAEVLNINDYAGQMDKIKYLFTAEGWRDFCCGLCGKMLYLGMAGFGLVYFGVAACIREWKTNGKNKYIYLFLLLSLTGEVLINTIYNIRPLRVDSVVYGRYDEFVLPVFMMLGAFELQNSKKTGTWIGAIMGLHAIWTYLVLFEIRKYRLTNIHGYVMVGMGYLYQADTYTPNGFFAQAYVFGSILMIAVMLLLRAAGRKRSVLLMTVVILLEFLLFTRASQIYLDEPGKGAYRDCIMADKIETLLQREEDRQIIYLQEKEDVFIGSIQFLLPDETIRVMQTRENVDAYTEEEMDSNDIILVDFDSSYGEELAKKYQCNMTEGRFQVYYN